jgi:hypothetical protein
MSIGTRSKVSNETLKRLELFCNSDAAATVVMVMRKIRILTPGLHSSPNTIFSSAVLPMPDITMRGYPPSPAATRNNGSLYKGAGWYEFFPGTT